MESLQKAAKLLQLAAHYEGDGPDFPLEDRVISMLGNQGFTYVPSLSTEGKVMFRLNEYSDKYQKLRDQLSLVDKLKMFSFNSWEEAEAFGRMLVSTGFRTGNTWVWNPDHAYEIILKNRNKVK